MNNRLRIGLILTIMLAVAVLAAFWAKAIFHQPPFETRRMSPPGSFIQGDFEYFYVAFTIISTINIALLAVVLLTYINIYNKTRSLFTIGIIIFAFAFLIKDILSPALP